MKIRNMSGVSPHSGGQKRSDEPVVSLEDVSVEFEEGGGLLNVFSDPESVKAVTNTSLDIPENDVIALVGESGCGKTTLGKSVIGLQRPTSGTVRYRGQDIWDAKYRREDVEIPFREIRKSLQIIHQDPGESLNPHKRVLHTLSVPLKKAHPELGRTDRRARILDMLERVGMTPPTDYVERYPHQLSGGEQQRIALVRALLMNPDLILADEAVSALDVSLRIEMMDLMLDLQDEFNTSFVFISHDLANAWYLTKKAGGRIGVMYMGEIVEIGPPEEIVLDPKHPYTKALSWAVSSLQDDKKSNESPLRSIDIPDQTNPPEGCRFHTRCSEAREVCTSVHPKTVVDEESDHRVACFRTDPDHEYWDSESIT